MKDQGHFCFPFNGDMENNPYGKKQVIWSGIWTRSETILSLLLYMSWKEPHLFFSFAFSRVLKSKKVMLLSVLKIHTLAIRRNISLNTYFCASHSVYTVCFMEDKRVRKGGKVTNFHKIIYSSYPFSFLFSGFLFVVGLGICVVYFSYTHLLISCSVTVEEVQKGICSLFLIQSLFSFAFY